MNTATTNENNALAVATDAPNRELAMASPGNTALILDPQHFQNMMAVAELMASGTATVPKHLQRNRGDCLAVVMQATQWGMNPFAVGQKTHLVNGTLGYEAQLVIAVINNSGMLRDRLHWKWFGPWEKIVGRFKTVESRTKKDDDGNAKKYIVPDWRPEDEQGLGVTCIATLKGCTEPIELTLLMSQARTRNSTLWTEDPKQQLAYLSAKRWGRLYTPDAILGVYTPDELQEQAPKDMGRADVLEPEIPAALLKQATDAAKAGVAEYQKFWAATGVANRKTLAGRHDGFKQDATNADAQRTVDNAPPAAAPAQAAAPSPAPAVTYASVLDKMVKAASADALSVAADWIGEVADAEQRAELAAKYTELAAKFGGAA